MLNKNKKKSETTEGDRGEGSAKGRGPEASREKKHIQPRGGPSNSPGEGLRHDSVGGIVPSRT